MKFFKNINSGISCFCIRNKNLIIVDEYNKIYYLNEKLEIINSFKLPLKNKADEKSVKISNNGKFLLIAVKKYLFLWDLETKINKRI